MKFLAITVLDLGGYFQATPKESLALFAIQDICRIVDMDGRTAIYFKDGDYILTNARVEDIKKALKEAGMVVEA